MQIHEITQVKLDEGIGSFLGGLAGRAQAATMGSGTSDFSAARQDPVRQKQIQVLANKSYQAWKQYEKTLLQSNPDARQTPMYQQALLAFVTKNLLGGQYLPNVINRQQIEALVKQLSAGGGGSAPAGDGGAGKQPISIGKQKLDPNKPEEAKIIDALRKQGKIQEVKIQEAESQALTPQEEKDLWLKLTQQAAVATTTAPGTGTGGTKTAQPTAGDNNQAGDARSFLQQMQADQQTKAVLQSLAGVGRTYAQKVGSSDIQSTGNPVADALLLAAGFRGI